MEEYMFFDQLTREKYSNLAKILEIIGGEKYSLQKYTLGELLKQIKIDLDKRLKANLTDWEKKKYFEYQFLSA